MSIRFIRNHFANQMRTEAEASLAKLAEANAEKDSHRAHGMRWGIAESLANWLSRKSGALADDLMEESNDLRARLVDELWEDGDFACGHDATICPKTLADDLRKEWRRKLGGLPEVLSEWLADLLFEVVSPESVAEALCDRVRAYIEPGYDNDPQPDHTYLEEVA